MRRFERLANELAFQIESGVFRPGDRLPSVRTLRTQRRVSMNTASEALAELERRGLAYARPRSGFYVRPPPARLPRPSRRRVSRDRRAVALPALADRFVTTSADPRRVPLGGAVLSPDLLPARDLARATRAALARTQEVFGQYGAPAGDPGLRSAVARLGRDWRLSVSPDHVVVTSGCMDAVRLALTATTSPGDLVAVESPTFFGFLRLVRDLGHPVVEIPVDPQHGLDLDALAWASQHHPIRALITTPTLHNPTGATLDDTGRAKLCALARDGGFALIEDDVYAFLSAPPRRPLLSFDPDGPIVLCGSFSKVVSPALRVGYAISPCFAQALSRRKLSGTICSAGLNQRVIRTFLEEGRFDRHVRRLVGHLDRQRQDLARSIDRHFPAACARTDPSGGFLLWVSLPAGASAMALHHRADEHGISVLPGPLCSASEGFGDCVRLSAGFPFTEAHEDAVAQLGAWLR